MFVCACWSARHNVLWSILTITGRRHPGQLIARYKDTFSLFSVWVAVMTEWYPLIAAACLAAIICGAPHTCCWVEGSTLNVKNTSAQSVLIPGGGSRFFTWLVLLRERLFCDYAQTRVQACFCVWVCVCVGERETERCFWEGCINVCVYVWGDFLLLYSIVVGVREGGDV